MNKKVKKNFLLSSLLCLLTLSTSGFAAVPTPVPLNTKIPLSFSSIDISGCNNIILKQGAESSIEFTHTSQYVPHYAVVDHTLHIYAPPFWKTLWSLGKWQRFESDMIITVPNLQTLAINGDTSLTAHAVQFPNVSIFDDSSGDLALLGNVGVEQLTTTGSGNVKISWVNSNQLILTGYGSGTISVSGVAHTVYANLGKTQLLEARYLRAPVVNVHAQDDAVANVLSSGLLNAFAYDHSTIVYFKWPDALNQMSDKQGNVIQEGWFN